MIAGPSKRPFPMTDPVVVAVLISLAIHLSGFGIWKVGSRLGWWKENRFSSWVQRIGNKLLPTPKFQAAQKQPDSEPPLMFIEVNPAQALSQPPKNAKFQGAVSTQAASSKQSEDEIPQVDGEQTESLKLTENATPKALPLQPSPKVTKPDKEDTEEKPAEKQSVGDIAFAKPSENPPKPDSNQNGKDDKTRRRPRTIAEAQKKAGTLGEKSKQHGGSKQLDLSAALDVKGTALGDYVAEMVEAIKVRWYDQLDQVSATTPGRVVIEFRLHSNGRVSNVHVGRSDVGEMLSLICQKAIQDPSPYKPWPKELRHEMNADYRDVTFTFSYLRN